MYRDGFVISDQGAFHIDNAERMAWVLAAVVTGVLLLSPFVPSLVMPPDVAGPMIAFDGFLVGVCIYGRRIRMYRRATWSIDPAAVSNRIGKQVRSVGHGDVVQAAAVSVRHAVTFGGRGTPLVETYLALWGLGSREPECNATPYRLLRETEVVLLPDTADVREALRKNFGIAEIPVYPQFARYDLTVDDGLASE